MSFFTPTRVFSALIFGAVIAPIVASAEPAYGTQVAIVSTTGMDASKPADQAILRHRIAVAAHRLCTQVTQQESLTSPAYTACVATATTDAKAQLGVQIAKANSSAMIASVSQ